jgi:hypothetical protein
MSDAPGDVPMTTKMESDTITASERQVLRRLAGEVAALAARPIEAEKARLWTLHNDLTPERPMIFCDPEHGWEEIITDDQLQCQSPLARSWERGLRKEIFWGRAMCDDRVIEPFFNLFYVYTNSGWGLKEVNIGGEHGGARRWVSPIKSLDDLSGLHFQQIEVDYLATQRQIDLAGEIFGDLLKPRLRGSWYWSLGLTWEFIKLRGLNELMLDMYDNPSGLHRLMAFLRDGTMDWINTLERQGLFTLNNEGDYVGSGGFGWTKQLPTKGFDGLVRTRDLWVLSESQETVGVSPEMFSEFIFPYQLPLLERFGLACYGCCEPVHARWKYLKRIPNLRRVSVSPWCDRAKMAEYLSKEYVYSLKAHPGLLAGVGFDEDAIRKDVRDALDKAGGCALEILMKDNHTIGKDPSRPTRWVKIAREEIDRRF